MNSGIYIITNKTNGHRYVGSSVDLKNRFRRHRQALRNETHYNAHLQRAWNKYGEEAFLFEILEEWESEFLISMEQWWMNMLHPEYNIAPVAGNTLGVRPPEEVRAKLSTAHMGYKASAETKAKMSAAQMGRKMPPRSKEWRAKQRAAHIGRKLSKEHRANISAGNMGHIVSEETRAKLSVALKGRNIGHKYLLGYKHTAEAKAKISAAQNGRKKSEKHRLNIIASLIGNHRARKLTQPQVHEIRHLLALGDMLQGDIAKHFPVGIGVINRINAGRIYADW